MKTREAKEQERMTEKAIRVETKVNLSVSVCVCGWGVVLYYINKKNKEQRTVWWKYACSFDRRTPMTSVVLGDIGGDTHKSCWSCRDAHAHTYNPSFSAWIRFFAPQKKKKKVFQSCPATRLTPLLMFVPSLPTWWGVKFPQVKWQLTSRPLWCSWKLLSHRRPPSVSRSALSCPFFFFFFFCELFTFFLSFFRLLSHSFSLSSLFFGAANTERDLIDKRCSISQQISSFVCLWLCLESFFFFF